MNRPFVVLALAGPDRLKAGLQTSGVLMDRFIVPMHGKNGVGALHEPTRPSDRSLPWESGAKDARTPDASRLPGVSEPREASGVRPIYRRFSSGAGRPAVRGPSTCGNDAEASHESPGQRLKDVLYKATNARAEPGL